MASAAAASQVEPSIDPTVLRRNSAHFLRGSRVLLERFAHRDQPVTLFGRQYSPALGFGNLGNLVEPISMERERIAVVGVLLDSDEWQLGQHARRRAAVVGAEGDAVTAPRVEMAERRRDDQ